jgi:hypothetical protein
VHHGQVVPDIERTDLAMGKAPQQIGGLGPAVLGGVAAPLRQCPALIKAGLRAVHPPPGRADESVLVFAGEFVDLLGAARRHACFAIDQATKPRRHRSFLVMCAANDQCPNCGGEYRWRGRACLMPRWQGPFPLCEHRRQIWMFCGQARLRGIAGEPGVGPSAEVPDCPAADPGRRVRKLCDRSVVDPFIGQLPGQ